jgi:NADPH:quinone reductase-like Zn-dependent oxidoreductase
MKYKSVIVTKRGGPDFLQVIENDLRLPSAGEVRIKILAAPVCLPDVEARYGCSPFKPSRMASRLCLMESGEITSNVDSRYCGEAAHMWGMPIP